MNPPSPSADEVELPQDEVELPQDKICRTESLPSVQKWMAAIVSGGLFGLFVSPQAYALTSSVVSPQGRKACPTIYVLLLHAVLFGIVIRIFIDAAPGKESCVRRRTSKDKWQMAGVSSLVFLLAASPVAMQVTGCILSKFGFLRLNEGLCPTDGCGEPTIIVVHAILVVLVIKIILG